MQERAVVLHQMLRYEMRKKRNDSMWFPNWLHVLTSEEGVSLKRHGEAWEGRLKSIQKNVNSKVEEVKKEVGDVKKEVGDVKKEVKKEVGDVKKELKKEIAELRNDMAKILELLSKKED